VGGYTKSEIDTTFLLFLYQNLLTCTLYLKRIWRNSSWIGVNVNWQC